MIFQDPYGSLNPRRRVGSIIGDPFADPRDRRSSGREAPGPGADGARRASTRSTTTGSRPSSPGGQRQRIGVARALALQPEADRLRRAGLRTRRLDPGADHQPARRPAEGVRAHLHLHLPRPLGDASRQRPDRGDVPRQGRGAAPAESAVRAAQPAPLHPVAAVGPAARPTPTSPRRASASSSSATCPSPIFPPSGCRFHTRCPKARATARPTIPPSVPGPRRPSGPPDGVPAPAEAGRRPLAVHPRVGDSEIDSGRMPPRST